MAFFRFCANFGKTNITEASMVGALRYRA